MIKQVSSRSFASSWSLFCRCWRSSLKSCCICCTCNTNSRATERFTPPEEAISLWSLYTLYISYPCIGWYTEELWVSDFEWSCTVSGPTNNLQHYSPWSSQTMVMECQVCPTSSDFERRTFMKACANFISLLISPLPQLLLLQAAPSITMYS